MNVAFEWCRGLSIVAFLVYGASCIFTQHMAAEFERYGLSRLRRFVGVLEVLGAVGLLVGFVVPAMTLLASAGLVLLMALGVATRIRVRDPFPQMLPAVFLLLVNGFVFAYAASR